MMLINPDCNPNANGRKWIGYNLAELRDQRTLVNARIVIERHRLAHDIKNLRGNFSDRTRPATVVGRLLGALSYMDWAIVGITLIRKFGPLFKRRK